MFETDSEVSGLDRPWDKERERKICVCVTWWTEHVLVGGKDGLGVGVSEDKVFIIKNCQV